jgi:hypothetical protein
MPRHGLVKPIEASRAFDIDITPPVVVEISPRADAVVRELTQIEVVFDGNVQGVDAADLLINGQPATDVTVYSPRDYLFRFPEPAVGRVEVAWALGHGITDQASPPNTFAGGNWSYTLERSRPVSSVIISELMADNESGIRDDDSDRSDWIELLNLGPEEVNLEGWYLTDTVINLSRWRFPAVHLGVNEYLLVWASQKNRTNPLAPLHTDFKLEKDGEYLALIDPGTNVASEFYPSYPPQTANVSYGRDRVSPSVVGYFYTPTPGAPNSTAGPGFAPAPLFSEDSGVFTNAWLAVALSAPSGTIHYTVDGSLPTTNSAIFSTPLVISASAVVKARTFQEGLLPSEIVAKSYLLLDSAAANFSSTLPVMIYSTGGRGIAQDILPGQPRTFASVAVFDTFRGRSSVSRKPDYQGLCELEVRGQSSAGFPKKPYNVEIQDAYRNDLAVSLAGLPAESDWVLCNPYSDKPFLQNCLALELHEKMGHYAVRRRFVEVFVNTVAGRVTYPRDYAGIYLLMEKIEIGKNRLDLERLSPYDNAEPDITGGYIFKKDKDSQGDLNFTTVGGGGFSRQVLKIHDPKPREITPAQFGWLRNYVNQFERALYAPNWTKATGTNHYSWYIDVDSFVDNHWIVEFSKQIDGYRLSNFIHKNRGGKIKMAPIWDWNLSFGNADYLEGWMTNGWYYPLISENEHLWLRRLINGTPSGTGTSGDPDFNQKIIDRWSVLRTNIFAASNVLARVDELAALLTEPAARDFKKWPRLGTYIWPNPEFYVKPTTYAGIIAAMKKWIQGRYAWIDAQFVRCPMLSVNGGPVPMGFSLTISAPAGTTYYTLDGSDPRLAGGGVSPGAFVYSAPVSLNANARVFARARSGSKWSGPTAATFVVRRPPLLITEIMYHPGEPPPGCTNEAGDFAYVELKNSGATTVNLDGYRLSGAIAFTFSNQILAAGQRILVVRNRSAFESRYGTSHAIAGEYVGQLGNGERRLILTGPLQEPVLEFSFDTRWYPVADGAGFSLVAVDEDTPVETWGCKEQWRASTTVHGSPGEPDPPHVVHPRVVISEVLSHPAPGARDAIEVQNLSETDVDISGWFLTDDFYTPKKYRVPHGTAIPAGGFLVFSAMEASGGGAEGLPFGVSALGDEAYLFSGDANTNLTGYIHGFTFDAQKAGVTFGRYVTSDGKEHFVAQRANTMGGPNAGPWIGPVVISEIMYHPPDVLTNGASWDNGEDEYIELHNRSSAPVNLFDPAHSGNRWRLARAVEFQFPDETVLAPGGYLLVVSFDPALEPAQLAAFVARYSVPIGVPILGPYRGRLRNSGDKVALYEPDEPVPAGPASGEVPYVLVDQVHYSDQPPWPPAADGMGHALNRRDPTQFGDDPANWDGSVPTPGRAYLGGAAPIITSQPRGRLALASQLVVLGVSAESVGPVRYQWRYNGMNIAGATNETLVLTNVQPQQTGEYQVVVLNLTSSVVSEAAWLTIENDSDADGMGDPWELAHGFNPYHGGDADTDADQDGMSNLNEYLAGTDPRDSRSGLKIEGIVASDGVTLWFTAVSNRTYAIEASDALHLSRWTRLIKVDSRSTNRTDRVTDSRSNAERYYRLVLVP